MTDNMSLAEAVETLVGHLDKRMQQHIYWSIIGMDGWNYHIDSDGNPVMIDATTAEGITYKTQERSPNIGKEHKRWIVKAKEVLAQ